MKSFNDTIDLMRVDMYNNGDTPDIKSEINDFSTSVDQFLSSMQHVEYTLDALKLKIKGYRQNLESDALTRSYQIYANRQRDPNKDKWIFGKHNERNMIDDPAVMKFYNDRISFYTSWQYPGVVIRPLLGEHLNAMLASDPLYILDEDPELLQPTKKLFNKKYQGRLQYKIINESSPAYIRNILPNNQIGFMLINEYLNVRPFDLVKEYLKEIYEVLRPGGVALITFNNGDIPQATKNFEAGMYCYTPATLLLPLVELYGFEIIQHVDTSINVSWIEIRKPGTLTSLRGGQALREIK